MITTDERTKFRAKRRRELRSRFPTPYLQTDTSLQLGDGFATDYVRRMAYARAKAAGISTAGKIYMPSLADTRGHADPDAWIPHSDFRSRVADVCRERGHSCNGTVNVASPEPESDPLYEPYRPAPDIIEPEVEQINETEHEGRMTEQQKQNLREELTERYSGDL